MSKALPVVMNPAAGGGKAKRLAPKVCEGLRRRGYAPELLQTERRGHAGELVAQALAHGAEGVMIIGGDGTANEALAGLLVSSEDAPADLAFQDRWLSFLSAGTGGDFRRTLALPRKLEEGLDRFAASEPRRIDVGLLQLGDQAPRAFLNVLSLGLGGDVDQMMDKLPRPLKGRLGYLACSVARGLVYGTRRLAVSLDGGPERVCQALNLAIANGRYFGGGMEIAPKARLDDGLLDLVSLERPRVLGQLALIAPLYRGTILETSQVWSGRAASVHVRLEDEPDPVRVDFDGEPLGVLEEGVTLHAKTLPSRLWIR